MHTPLVGLLLIFCLAPLGAVSLLDDRLHLDQLAEVELGRPTADADPATRFWWFWTLSDAAYAARRYDYAEQALREALVLAPTCVPAWTNLSVMLGKQGRYAEALAAATHALTLDRDNLHARLIAPSWRLGLGEREQALVDFVAIPVPDDADNALLYWGAVACFYADVGNVEKTAEGIHQSLALDPEIRTFFTRDVVFDPYRGEAWFIALVGVTLAEAL